MYYVQSCWGHSVFFFQLLLFVKNWQKEFELETLNSLKMCEVSFYYFKRQAKVTSETGKCSILCLNILKSIILLKYFLKIMMTSWRQIEKFLKPIYKIYFIIYFTFNIWPILKSIHKTEHIKYFNTTSKKV